MVYWTYGTIVPSPKKKRDRKKKEKRRKKKEKSAPVPDETDDFMPNARPMTAALRR